MEGVRTPDGCCTHQRHNIRPARRDPGNRDVREPVRADKITGRIAPTACARVEVPG
jgi:hypothetical protein